MRPCRAPLILALVLVLAGDAFAQPSLLELLDDEAYLKSRSIAVDTESLFALLRHQAGHGTEARDLQTLIATLGDTSFMRRDQAARKLYTYGPAALKRLESACDAEDLETRTRARTCIAAIEARQDKMLGFHAVRAIIRRRPPGAAAVLLAYLPAADAETVEEIWLGMEVVAVRAGKVDPAVRAALTDAEPRRRILAAFLLGCHGTNADRAKVRACLADKDPEMSLRAAQGLLASSDSTAVPTLLGLLENAPRDVAWQAEELLHWIAGADAPGEILSCGSDQQRRDCRMAWEAWWRTAGPRVDWERGDRTRRLPGLIEVNGGRRVALYGCDGQVRWRTGELPRAAGVHLFPDQRMLVLEELAGRATLHDLQSQSEEPIALPTRFLRGWKSLANGHVLVLGSNARYEISSDGQTVASTDWPAWDVQYALPLRGNRLLGRTTTGVAEIDGVTGALACYAVANKDLADVLLQATFLDRPAARPGTPSNNVVRRDKDANVVWRHPAVDEAVLLELPNGNLVVGPRQETRLYELTPDGRTVWEIHVADPPTALRDKFPLLRLGFERPANAATNLDSVDNRIKDLTNPDVRVRETALKSLSRQGPRAERAISALLKLLGQDDSKDSDTGRAAIGVLHDIGSAAVPALIDAIGGSSKSRRYWALEALAGFGDEAKPAVPALVALVKDSAQAADVRLLAAVVLGRIGPGAEAAVPVLIDALNGDDDVLRNYAALSLMSIGMRKSEALEPLLDALNDFDYPLGRCGAAQALGALGRDAWEAAPELNELVADVSLSHELRRCAAHALGDVGLASRPTVNLLAAVLRDPEEMESVRLAALSSLHQLMGKEVTTLPAFIETFSSEKLPRDLLEGGLSVLRILDEDAIPALSVLVLDGHPRVRGCAIELLKKQGWKAESALPMLELATTEDDEWSLRKQAADACLHITDDVARRHEK